MSNGYSIKWTEKALNELKETLNYLKERWTSREVERLSIELESTLTFISENPYLFQQTNEQNVRRAVILKYNSLFYLVNSSRHEISILSFKNNRKSK